MIAVNTTSLDLYQQYYTGETQSTSPVIEQVISPNEIASRTPRFFLDEFDLIQTTQEIPVPVSPETRWESATQWRGAILERFDELSLKDAICEITSEESRELSLLLHKRRILHHPRSAVEIERDIRNERALRKVMEGLSEYVRAI